MDQLAFLRDLEQRLSSLIARGEALRRVPTPKLNQRPANGEWSPAQVLEHLRLTNEGYVSTLPKCVQEAKPVNTAPEVKFTWLGRALLRASEPSNKSVPVPAKLIPGEGPFSGETVYEFLTHHRMFLTVVRNGFGKDLGASRLRHPLVPFLKLSPLDVLATVTLHGERHMAQIEERLK